MSILDSLLARNTDWAAGRIADDPDYFRARAAAQTPKYMWIGCADSRVPPLTLLGLEPGDMFVHRNVGNIVNPDDPNCMSAVEFAVDGLGVEHIIVCGHDRCGAVRAAQSPPEGRVVDTWIAPLRALAANSQAALAACADDGARDETLAAISVRTQVAALANSAIIRRARARGRSLHLHGWMYHLAEGRLRDLKVEG